MYSFSFTRDAVTKDYTLTDAEWWTVIFPLLQERSMVGNEMIPRPDSGQVSCKIESDHIITAYAQHRKWCRGRTSEKGTQFWLHDDYNEVGQVLEQHGMKPTLWKEWLQFVAEGAGCGGVVVQYKSGQPLRAHDDDPYERLVQEVLGYVVAIGHQDDLWKLSDYLGEAWIIDTFIQPMVDALVNACLDAGPPLPEPEPEPPAVVATPQPVAALPSNVHAFVRPPR